MCVQYALPRRSLPHKRFRQSGATCGACADGGKHAPPDAVLNAPSTSKHAPGEVRGMLCHARELSRVHTCGAVMKIKGKDAAEGPVSLSRGFFCSAERLLEDDQMYGDGKDAEKYRLGVGKRLR